MNSLVAQIVANGGNVYALFDKKDAQKSEWYIKLGAAQLDNIRKGKRFTVKDWFGKEYPS